MELGHPSPGLHSLYSRNIHLRGGTGLAQRVCSGKRQLLLLDQAHSKWKSEGCFREGGGVCLSCHCCRRALFSDLTCVSPSSTCWGGGGAAILCSTRENTGVQGS